MKIKEQQAKCDLRGVNITRKYVDENRTVIAWVTIVEPVAFSGAPVAGVRFRESGALVLTPGPTTSSSSRDSQHQQMKSSTQMQMCCRFAPDMKASEITSATGDQETSGGGGQVVGAVTDFLINSIEGNISFTNMMIDKLLRSAPAGSTDVL